MTDSLLGSPITESAAAEDSKEGIRKTLLCVILDESGSMHEKRNDTIGGYNRFLHDQSANNEDSAIFFFVKFNTVVTVVHRGIPIECVPKLTNATFVPGGGTALYDAIAEGVSIVEAERTCNERVVCVIMTDGRENSSKETSFTAVKELISKREATGDWTFVYIGEEPMKWANDTGMSQTYSSDYMRDVGADNFRVASQACCALRSQSSTAAKRSSRK